MNDVAERRRLIDRILRLPGNTYPVSELEKYPVTQLQGYLNKLAARTIPPDIAAAISQATAADQEAALAQKAAAEQVKQDWILDGICATPINGRTAPNTESVRKMILGWLNPGEELSVAWFKRVLAENPALGDQIFPQKLANIGPSFDKETFAKMCREHQRSECEANFDMWCRTHSIAGLIPASPEELEAYRKEAILSAADNPVALRKIANQEFANRVPEAEKQAQRDANAQAQRDAVLGFPPLPYEYPFPGRLHGQKLDAAFIRSCPPEIQKLLTRRFGSAQLTARLRGVA
jgi:hypothetical protein